MIFIADCEINVKWTCVKELSDKGKFTLNIICIKIETKVLSVSTNFATDLLTYSLV